jgi:hypothetical protein
MVEIRWRYTVEYEILVFGLWDMVHAVSHWNFGSASKKDSKSYHH